MSKYNDRHPSHFTCMDHSLKSVPSSGADHGGSRFHFIEGRCNHFLVLHMITPENYHVQFVPSNMTI